MGWLLIEKKYKLLKKIKYSEGSSISELEVYANHGGTSINLNILVKMDLVVSRKEGRKITSKLTKKGKKILEHLEFIDKKLLRI